MHSGICHILQCSSKRKLSLDYAIQMAYTSYTKNLGKENFLMNFSKDKWTKGVSAIVCTYTYNVVTGEFFQHLLYYYILNVIVCMLDTDRRISIISDKNIQIKYLHFLNLSLKKLFIVYIGQGR